MMQYKPHDVVKATVTKSRPGQDVGLALEKRKRRVYVKDVSGLFHCNNVPVDAGDQLLEVNGISVGNKAEFPNGMKDVEVFLRKEWNIWVKVKKGPGQSLDKTEATHLMDSDSDSADSSLDDSENERELLRKNSRSRSRSIPRRKRQPRNSPFAAFSVGPEKRRGKKKLPSNLNPLDDSGSTSDFTSTTHSMSSNDTPPRSERRTCQTEKLVNINEGETNVPLAPPPAPPLTPSLTSSLRPKKQLSKVDIRSLHGTGRSATNELDNGNKVEISPKSLMDVVAEQDGKLVTRSPGGKSLGANSSGSKSPEGKSPGSKFRGSKSPGKNKRKKKFKTIDIKAPPLLDSSERSSERPKSKKSTRRSSMTKSSTGSKTEDSLDSSERSTERPKMKLGDMIKSKKATRRSSMPMSSTGDSLDSSQRSTERPKMKLGDMKKSKKAMRRSSMPMSSTGDSLDSSQRSTDRPKMKESKTGDSLDSSERSSERPKMTLGDMIKSKKATRRSSMPLFSSGSVGDSVEAVAPRPQSSRSVERDSKLRAPDLSALKNLVKADNAMRVSISKLLADHSKKKEDKPSSMASRISHTSPSTRNLINKLRKAPRRCSMPMLTSIGMDGQALRNITEEHSERKRTNSFESKDGSSHSMRSTFSCMTNLIDAGDLMKITGFTTRPQMNEATVEVVRKSRGQKGQRWDVRVISEKHIENTSFNDKRLISVDKSNLKHFM